MPDIELLDLWNRSDWTQVQGGQTVSGVDCKTKIGGESRGLAQRIRWRRIIQMVRELTSVQLDRLGPNLMRHSHRIGIGPDK